MFKVIGIRKTNKSNIVIIIDNLTEQQAERFCEAWGWSYTDENNISYWLDYETM